MGNHTKIWAGSCCSSWPGGGRSPNMYFIFCMLEA